MTDMALSDDFDLRQQLESFSVSSRRALLRVIVWVFNQSNSSGDSGHQFIANAARSLELEFTDIQKAQLEAAQAQSAAEVVDGLGSEVPRLFVVGLLISISLADGVYDARQRTALRRLIRVFGIDDSNLEDLEHHAFKTLRANIDHDQLKLSATSQQRRDDSNNNTKWIVGGAILGGALLGATGLMAAPAIGGLLGVKALGLSGAAATSAGTALFGGGSLASGGLGIAGGKAVIASLFGLGGAVMGGRRAAHRTGELEQFELETLQDGGSRAILGVSGFLSQEQDFEDHWDGLHQFFGDETINAVRWESSSLKSLGKSLGVSAACMAAKQQASAAASQATRAAASSIGLPLYAMAALKIIDNPWSVARNRAEQAGEALADVLRQQPWGQRPVTLVGFSLGARVIVHALSELSAGEIGRRIEAVYLLGGAVAGDCRHIDEIQHSVSGPVINGYCDDDWVLKYLYRIAEWETAAGCAPLNRDHILDVDLTEIVDGHLDYNSKLPRVLHRVTQAAHRQDPEQWSG